MSPYYCWWFRNPAHQLRLVVHPNIYRVSYIPGGAGFLPSTVSPNNALIFWGGGIGVLLDSHENEPQATLPFFWLKSMSLLAHLCKEAPLTSGMLFRIVQLVSRAPGSSKKTWIQIRATLHISIYLTIYIYVCIIYIHTYIYIHITKITQGCLVERIFLMDERNRGIFQL